MNFLDRELRESIRAQRSLMAVAFKGAPPNTELIPFIVNIPRGSIPPWLRDEEVQIAIELAVTEAVTRLPQLIVTPGQVLARKNIPAEIRSQAARSMLAMRGGKATAAKMRKFGYPNLGVCPRNSHLMLEE
jgi:hypothetical protein